MKAFQHAFPCRFCLKEAFVASEGEVEEERARVLFNKRRNVKNPKYRNKDGSFNQKKYDADKGIGPKGRRAERQNPTTKKSVSQVKGDIEFKKDLKKWVKANIEIS